MTDLSIEVAEFAHCLAPKQVVHIRDGYAKDFFLDQRYKNFEKYFSKFKKGFQRRMS